MLQRLLEQQAAIAAVLMEGKVRHLMPESDDWMVIEILVDILKPFQHAKEVMSAVKYPTVSTVKPLLHKLLEQTLKVSENDGTTEKEVKQTIRSDLQGRYQNAAVRKIMNVTIFLDPRYKDLPFLDAVSKRKMMNDELLMLEVDESTENFKQEDTVCKETDEPPSKKPKGPVSKLLGELFKGKRQSCLHSDRVSTEMDLYKAEKPAELDSDPLEWWYIRKSLYPLMRRLVETVLWLCCN